MGEALRWLTVPVPMPAVGRLESFEASGERLVLANVSGVAHVIEDRCPHAGVALGPGRLEGCVLECPFHGGKLDVRTGAPVALPIRSPVRTFPVREGAAGLEVGLHP